MENQIQIKTRITNLALVIIFWIYTFIHFIVVLYYCITNVDFRNFYPIKVRNILILSIPFILFLITTIFVTVNYCSNVCKLYICLIPSLINEVIFIGILIFLIILIDNAGRFDSEIVIFLIIFLFFLESIPNILLFIYIYKKTKNKNSKNIDIINNNAPLLNNN